MATKKKVDDEAGDSPEVVDEAPVDEATADAETTGVEDVDTRPLEAVEESTPVESAGDEALAIAQGIVGVPSTGVFNHATKMAIRKFQQQHGLPPSGVLDVRTKAAMHIV